MLDMSTRPTSHQIAGSRSCRRPRRHAAPACYQDAVGVPGSPGRGRDHPAGWPSVAGDVHGLRPKLVDADLPVTDRIARDRCTPVTPSSASGAAAKSAGYSWANDFPRGVRQASQRIDDVGLGRGSASGILQGAELGAIWTGNCQSPSSPSHAGRWRPRFSRRGLRPRPRCRASYTCK